MLALQGREPEALDVVRRLKLFADAESTWLDNLALLYEMCEQQGTALAGFKAHLFALYGMGDDDSDDAN